MASEIQGIAEALAFLDKYPFTCDKVINSAMRKASSVLVKQIKGGMPKAEYKKLVKSKVFGKRFTIAKIGLYGPKSSSDGEITPWFKAYWANYGTLSRRDSSHKFQYARRTKSKNRMGGIRPQRFFEQSLEGGEQLMIKAFETELNKMIKKNG